MKNGEGAGWVGEEGEESSRLIRCQLDSLIGAAKCKQQRYFSLELEGSIL